MGNSKAKRLLFLCERQNWRCYYCSASIDHKLSQGHPREATIDHKLPKARGGTNHITNTVAACFRCNHRKGALTAEEFGAVITPERLAKLAALDPKFTIARAVLHDT